ncbi:alkene reductase [Aspergillus affinis]|uniref:alkene reductase n=1 Tax=Aspergillus affinis TaxID=1070780 RepID=UPI0022FF2437|nr:putative N-ethylmaleimide reductase [Aspergillus affinis]KAI9041411.1 putative N-ethylmaleimide reductase [Aspergillus affinis]
MAPLTRLRATSTHIPLPIAETYYTQRASIPGTLLIAEATMISPSGSGVPHAPGIWTPEQITCWKRVTDAVHAKGSYIILQLVALGRAADAATLKAETGRSVSAPSAIPMASGATVPVALSEAEICDLIRDFATAGKNAMKAGFDGVEVHGANGYLVDLFTQDVSNQRTDGWGGSIEKRARFGIEVARALSEAIGPERVGFRISPWNTWQGMKMAEPEGQFTYLVRKLRELGLGYLHVIESRVINNVDCEKSEGIEPFLEAWGREKPVLVAGGYNQQNAGDVDTVYQDNEVGVVFGRHFLANPDLPFRLKNGIPLQKYDRETFYTPMQVEGYLDYPFSAEFEASLKN